MPEQWGLPSVPEGRFREKGGRSAKIECTICGADGYRGGRWMYPHIRDHIFTCTCGKAFPQLTGLAAHVRLAKRGGSSHSRASGVSP